jgi:hypothetical protein
MGTALIDVSPVCQRQQMSFLGRPNVIVRKKNFWATIIATSTADNFDNNNTKVASSNSLRYIAWIHAASCESIVWAIQQSTRLEASHDVHCANIQAEAARHSVLKAVKLIEKR